MTEPSYYQRPSAMTEPIEAILDRRLKDLKCKYPEYGKRRRVSRCRFLLAGAMLLLAQDDKVVLDMLDIASMNMTMCRKAGE